MAQIVQKPPEQTRWGRLRTWWSSTDTSGTELLSPTLIAFIAFSVWIVGHVIKDRSQGLDAAGEAFEFLAAVLALPILLSRVVPTAGSSRRARFVGWVEAVTGPAGRRPIANSIRWPLRRAKNMLAAGGALFAVAFIAGIVVSAVGYGPQWVTVLLKVLVGLSLVTSVFGLGAALLPRRYVAHLPADTKVHTILSPGVWPRRDESIAAIVAAASLMAGTAIRFLHAYGYI